MIPQAIRMADFCLRTYKTRDPFEIIERRGIILRKFNGKNLLGYFRVHNRVQYIGLNENADEGALRTGAGHELGHSFLDISSASKGSVFQDTMLYSLGTSRSERNANLFDAELLIADEQILQRVYYKDYLNLTNYIQEHIGDYKTDRAKFDFEQDHMMEFYESHPDLGTHEELAHELEVDINLIGFKFQSLRAKGLDLPNIPETRTDFLKSWQHRSEW
jgi:hypothetical protein